MNSNTRKFSRAEVLLEEPHFDEEATLLSARPVVPLTVVEAKSRLDRRLVLGSAIVVALLIGAFASTLIQGFRSEEQPGDVPAVTAMDDASRENQLTFDAGVAGVAEEPLALTPKQQDEGSAGEDIRTTSPPLVSSQPPPRVARKVIRSHRQNKTREEAIAEQRELERETRRAERREERRARRVERERGARDSRPPDDLLRIREIFEGPKP